jgi:voltage-gated potassium channel
MIDELRDHIIVCGYGRVGQRAVEEFRASGVGYVVLDFSDAAAAAAERDGDLFVRGNGANDDDLVRAGLDRARGLLVASDDDADNLYITLSAKARRPDLTVIARGSTEDAGRKLKLAGADRVVTPYSAAGRVMAHLMTKPQVSAFVTALTSPDEPHLSFEEITVSPTCRAAGHTIGELAIQTHTGAYIVAIRKGDGTLEVRPSKDTRLDDGDVILGLGSAEEVAKLEELFEPEAAVAHRT